MQGIVNTKVKHKCVQIDVQNPSVQYLHWLYSFTDMRNLSSSLPDTTDHCVDFKDKSDDSLAGKKCVFKYF